MLTTENKTYDLIGKLAIALYGQQLQISLSSLNSILADKGLGYDSNRGLASGVSAAYRRWEEIDPVIHHAIAYTFTDKNGDLPWDK